MEGYKKGIPYLLLRLGLKAALFTIGGRFRLFTKVGEFYSSAIPLEFVY